jgi:hypothetical protein
VVGDALCVAAWTGTVYQVKRRAMVMVAALALAGGACGGDDDGDVSDDAVVSTTESNGAADSTGTDSGDAVEIGYTESDENDDDSGDDTADTVADESGDDSDSADGPLREQTIAQLIGVGLTEVQAECIVDNVPDLEEFARTGQTDPTAFLALVEPCAIDLSLLTPPDPGA